MISSKLFSVNTFNKNSLQKAKDCGFGLEVEEYLMMYNEDEIEEKHEYVPTLMGGFTKFSFHGTIVNRDITEINKISDEELIAIYNKSYEYACLHNISRIVYHANYSVDFETKSSWLNRQTLFWKYFLQDKPPSAKIYIENLIDETPEIMSQLCDDVGDSRFKICLDTGHACCNSSINTTEWIKVLGKRIEHVHLHNNDKLSDRHWSLGKGILDMAEIMRDLLEYTDAHTFVLECDFESSVQWLRQNNILLINE
ncbi:MAG: sugar phosphate isomerase/epimerase [Oscillospiraceae bacterium]|nr:sugar phosphate isomerase/epimerase [Oscillospiraceae bacterium]